MTRTNQEKLAARAAKHAKELHQCSEFIVRIVSPMYASCFEQETEFSEKFEMSARDIQNKYGHQAVLCFRLMFKLLQRGGMNRDGDGFSSSWVPNRLVIPAYRTWSEMTPSDEMTCKNLHAALIAGEAQELQWQKSRSKHHRGTWLEKNFRNTILKTRRQNKEARKEYFNAKAKEATAALLQELGSRESSEAVLRRAVCQPQGWSSSSANGEDSREAAGTDGRSELPTGETGVVAEKLRAARAARRVRAQRPANHLEADRGENE